MKTILERYSKDQGKFIPITWLYQCFWIDTEDGIEMLKFSYTWQESDGKARDHFTSLGAKPGRIIMRQTREEEKPSRMPRWVDLLTGEEYQLDSANDLPIL